MLMAERELPLSEEWREALEAFQATLENAMTRSYYTDYLLWFFESVDPGQVTSEDVYEFINHFCREGKRHAGADCTAGTHNTRLSVLRSWYKFLRGYRVKGEDGHKHRFYSGEDPTAGFKVKPTKPAPKGMTNAQLEQFFQAIESSDASDEIRLRDRSLFAFLLFHGRRIGEAQAMTVSDILESEIVDEHGHSRRAWCYQFVPLKRKIKTVEIAELEPQVKTMIDAWLATRTNLSPDMALWCAVGQMYEGKHVGMPHDPYKGLNTSAVNDRMKVYLKAAGLPLDMASHVWRHTSAQVRYLNGESILQIKHTLRHSSIATTQVYLERLCNASDPSLGKLRQQWTFLK